MLYIGLHFDQSGARVDFSRTRDNKFVWVCVCACTHMPVHMCVCVCVHNIPFTYLSYNLCFNVFCLSKTVVRKTTCYHLIVKTKCFSALNLLTFFQHLIVVTMLIQKIIFLFFGFLKPLPLVFYSLSPHFSDSNLKSLLILFSQVIVHDLLSFQFVLALNNKKYSDSLIYAFSLKSLSNCI